jgi:hypothetical protein
MRRHQPALLGGLFIGVLSSLPIVSACCCLWVVVGGVLTAYLQQQRSPEPVEAAEAALGGVIAGLVGAMILIPISAASMLFVDFQQQIRGAMDQWWPQVPSDFRERVIAMSTGLTGVVVLAAFTLPMYAVLGMLGGLLGFAIFRKKTPPSAPRTSDSTSQDSAVQ